MPSNPVVQLGDAGEAIQDPDQRIKAAWGERLGEQLAILGLTPKRFQRLLEDEEGLEVSLQTVYAWLSGAWAPAPSKQARIARVLKVPAHRLFPLEAA